MILNSSHLGHLFIYRVTKLTFSERYKIRVTVSERNSISLKKESFV